MSAFIGIRTQKDGLKHLEVYAPLDKLVIVVEDLCDDFVAACDELRKQLPALRQRKLRGVFLPVHATDVENAKIGRP